MCWACVRRRGVAAAVTACVVALLLAGCSGEPASPEQRIRERIGTLVRAVEEGSAGRAAESLHPQYRDERHAGRAAATRSLLAYLRRHRGIHLFTLVRDLVPAPDGGAAEAVVYVAMTGIPVDSVETLISLKADLYRFDIELLPVEEGDWLISRARWRRADPALL